MKKIAIFTILALLLVSAVSATTTTLAENSIAMDYYDSTQVEFCLHEEGVPLDVNILVDPICKDENDLLGCNEGDIYNPPGFSVVPNEATTGEDGCTYLNITTALQTEEAGTFYYTVNGNVGETTVGAETGTVQVPEFGVISALVVLGLVGLFIYKKRD